MSIFYLFSLTFLLIAMAFLIKPFRPGLAKVQFVIAIIFSLGVVFVYYRTGDIQAWNKFVFNEAQVKSMIKELRTPDKVIAKLKEKLEDNPESAEGWFLLGRLHRANNQISEAVTAFKKAIRFKPENVKYFNAYFEAKYWENGALFSKGDLDLIDVSKLPQPELLNLVAGHYFQHQDYKQSVAYWKKMATLLSEAPEVQKEVMEAIKKAEYKFKLQQGNIVTVQVDAAQATRSSYPASASVFIYVKTQNRKGPPVAVVRRNLSELKAEIKLSDAEAMLPSRTLSHYVNQAMWAVARIEPSGKLTRDPKLPEAAKAFKLKEGEVSLDLCLQCGE